MESTGSVSTLGATNLGFPTGGQLTSVRVAVGDQVTGGQVLATIDDFSARQALRQAESQLAAQEANYAQVRDATSVGGAQNSVDAAASVVSATRRQAAATLAADDAAISAARMAVGQAQAGAAQAAAVAAADSAACTGAYPAANANACNSLIVDRYNAAQAAQGVQMAQQSLTQAESKRNVDAAAGNLQVASARQGQVSAQNGLDSASASRPNSLDAAAAAVDGARAGVANARRALDNTTLRAPGPGTVSALNGGVGEFVAPSSSTTPFAPGSNAPIPGAAQAAGAAGAAAGAASPTRPGGTQFLVLQNVSQFAVVAPFQEVDAASVAPQQRAVVSLDAVPDRTFDGTVLSVAPSSVALGGSVEYYVTIALPNGDPRVHDGQSARASVTTATSEGKISVPNAALHRQGDKATVTVVTSDGRQTPTPVTTGLVGADRTEITSGLAEGQQVLLGRVGVSAPEGPEGSTATTATPVDDATPAEGTAVEGGETKRRGLKRSTKIGLAIIAVLAVAAAAAFAINYFVNSSKYVSTDNAQVDGTQIPIVAPAAGTLIGWRGTTGAVLQRDQLVGRVQVQGAYVQPQLPIRAPAAGTVANSDTTEGAYVTAGAQLAIAYDPNNVYVTARVDETDIDGVEVNRPVDFTVDAYPGRTFHGTVQEIQGGAAAVFSPFPQSNSGGNFQKVTQVIPVRIGIDDMQGLDLIPGMNVTVNIRKPGS